jgi:dTDP-4-amino-4,6-dideoxygalactose transaminase
MIPFFDYLPEYRRVRAEIDESVRRVLESGRLILGPEVEAFEAEFAAHVGVSRAVGVASGTDALSLALLALGVEPGDEVITVANAGVPPVAAIRSIGAVPRFVDVRSSDLQMDSAAIESAVGPRTRCVLPVHLYGQPAPLDGILEAASALGLPVVEDCAQAHGATYAGRHVGGFGRIGCFSFYPTKNLAAFGDGGICVSDDPEIEQRLRMLRGYGYRGDGIAHVEGRNSRLDELQAAILRARLRHLDRVVGERRVIARRYLDGLSGSSLDLPEPVAPGDPSYHLFVVRSTRRADLTAALDRAEIGHLVHYPHPVHRMEAYRFLGYREGDLPVTVAACASVLSLPLYPGLETERVDRIVGTVLDVA